MAKRPLTPNVVPATLVIAASNSLHPERADYRCDGVNDHIEIQAALDALPATGGEVVLLDGTYHIEVSLSLDSYQTLRGCGRNTILTTTTANLDIIMATGGLGTEKIGIVIADLCIDGNAGGVANDCGILWTYVDDSIIRNVWSQDNGEDGIKLISSDRNKIEDAYCSGNDSSGVLIYDDSYDNIVSGCICHNNVYGIYAFYGYRNIITGNNCRENTVGIWVEDTYGSIIEGNICEKNLQEGIVLVDAQDCILSFNHCNTNSQQGNNLFEDIRIWTVTNSLISNNSCRAGAEANKPNYGISIHNAGCVGCQVIDNDLYNDGFGTAPFKDAGTGTKLNVYVVPFVSGTDPQDSGFLIDLAAEYARAFLRLPPNVTQVVRMKVYARGTITEADKMRAEFVIYGGADNEPYNTHNGSVADHPSSSTNFLLDDIIYWTLVTAGVLALVGGDSVQVKVLHEVAGGADCQTGGYFRTVEIEYV